MPDDLPQNGHEADDQEDVWQGTEDISTNVFRQTKM
jgi:hypothetical protein